MMEWLNYWIEIIELKDAIYYCSNKIRLWNNIRTQAY